MAKVHYPNHVKKNKTRCGLDDDTVWVADEQEREQVTCRRCLFNIEWDEWKKQKKGE